MAGKATFDPEGEQVGGCFPLVLAIEAVDHTHRLRSDQGGRESLLIDAAGALTSHTASFPAPLNARSLQGGCMHAPLISFSLFLVLAPALQAQNAPALKWSPAPPVFP